MNAENSYGIVAVKAYGASISKNGAYAIAAHFTDAAQAVIQAFIERETVEGWRYFDPNTTTIQVGDQFQKTAGEWADHFGCAIGEENNYELRRRCRFLKESHNQPGGGENNEQSAIRRDDELATEGPTPKVAQYDKSSFKQCDAHHKSHPPADRPVDEGSRRSIERKAMTDTPTPRTDELEEKLSREVGRARNIRHIKAFCFARQLERELAEMTKQRGMQGDAASSQERNTADWQNWLCRDTHHQSNAPITEACSKKPPPPSTN